MSPVDTTNPGRPIHHRGDQLESGVLRFAYGETELVQRKEPPKTGKNSRAGRPRDEFYCNGTKEIERAAARKSDVSFRSVCRYWNTCTGSLTRNCYGSRETDTWKLLPRPYNDDSYHDFPNFDPSGSLNDYFSRPVRAQ